MGDRNDGILIPAIKVIPAKIKRVLQRVNSHVSGWASPISPRSEAKSCDPVSPRRDSNQYNISRKIRELDRSRQLAVGYENFLKFKKRIGGRKDSGILQPDPSMVL